MMLGVKVTKVDLSLGPIHQEMTLLHPVPHTVEAVGGWGWPISIRARQSSSPFLAIIFINPDSFVVESGFTAIITQLPNGN
eukprot:13361118-Ditylum_brightwellii.AAC.1